MRRLLLALALLVGAGCSDLAVQPGAVQAAPPSVVQLGALINQDPLGDPDTQAAIQLALEDVNAWSDTDFSLQVVGTGSDPERAVAGLEVLRQAGVRLVVGPETSDELAALIEPARAAGITLISHCSTAGSLAVAGDDVFRLVPTDASQMRVVAERMQAAGVTSVAILFRDDIFGQDLSASLKRELSARGIALAGEVSYSPEADDLSAQLAALEAAAGQAVELIAFGTDGARVLEQAAARPALRGVRWFGSDGTAISREIATNPVAAQMAVDTGFENPVFAAPQNNKTERIAARIRSLSGVETPHICSLTSYDAVWLAALTALARPAGPNGPGLVVAADNFFGASGWTELDANGDRLSGEYQIFMLENTGTGFEWVGPVRVTI